MATTGAAGLDVGMLGRRVRGYFAPVNRAAGTPTVFDPAVLGRFVQGVAPAPWVDLGWCAGFKRTSGTKVEAIVSGAPGTVAGQVRTALEAEVRFEFETWGRLQMALAAGAQTMNLLKGFSVGDLVAVDVDYVGQVGFVGSGVSGAYVRSSTLVGGDINYIRRVTLNVGRVATIAAGVLDLEVALPAGVPVTGMQVSPMVGYCDREGGAFFAEWSGMFCMDGEQGDRVIYHYPRLQAMQGAAEDGTAVAGGLERLRLAGAFQALSVVDGNDGESCVCFRSYFPAVRS
jgi:hypothetical protein